MSEFNLIRDFFTWNNPPSDVVLGVGDDAAVLSPPEGHELLVSVDTLVNGVHLPENTPAHAIGYKALAVNLSDLAAMGADPRWFTLALTLPEANPDWLRDFAAGLKLLAQQHGIFLIGGDTTRGPLSITIQVMGTVPRGKALLRSGAQTGDLLCVSGTLGDAAAGLAIVQNRLQLEAADAEYCINRLNYPSPRIELGRWLREHATSCMDISDGLLADLNHLLTRSGKGAKIQHQNLPFSGSLKKILIDKRLIFALNGGDDYELLFSIPADRIHQLNDFTKKNNIALSVIGHITDHAEQIELDTSLNVSHKGYNHFL